MRVVIVGAGKIGRYLSADLLQRGHEAALIERDAARLGRVAPEGAFTVVGDACDPQVLERGDVRRADVVVAATGDDEDNLVVSLLSKTEFAVPRVLARVNHPTNEWLFDDAWGVDLAVSPPHLLTAMVEEEISEGEAVTLLRLAHGAMELVEVTLDAHAVSVGQRVGELSLPPDTALVAVVRGEQAVPARQATALVEGDEVVALAPPGRRASLTDTLIGDL